MNDLFIDDTIAAIATAPGEGGIGIIRISGEKSLQVAQSIFKSKSGKMIKEKVNRLTIYVSLRHLLLLITHNKHDLLNK